MFSEEYQLPPPTQPAEEQERGAIEFQLEEEVRKEVRIYGTGKPRRDVIRAKIIHD